MIPARPFLVVGQFAAADPDPRARGHETAWAYTHVPQKTAATSAGVGLMGRA